MQRLGGDNLTNPSTADRAIHAHESSTSLDKQESQTEEDKTPAFAPTRTIGIGLGTGPPPPWEPGVGCLLDDKSPKKLKDVSEEKAQKIIKNIENEQAQGLKQGLRLEKKMLDMPDKKAGWDMFSDQDQELKVSFVSVMYQTVYVSSIGAGMFYGTA